MHNTAQIEAQQSANMRKRLAIPSPEQHGPCDALALLEQIGTILTFERNRAIVCQDDPVRFCYKVLSGCVRRVKFMQDGRRQVGEFLLPGDLFGFDDLGTHDFGAEAVSRVILRCYPRRMVEGLADDQLALSRRLRNMALVSLHTAHNRLMLFGRATATERVASFLLEMVVRLSERSDRVVDLPMTRSDMADHLGLSIETVCRIIAYFRRNGTIAVEHGGIKLRYAIALVW